MTGKRRRDRKLHRRFLDLGVIDASQDREWRRRLFSAPLAKSFVIDAEHTAGLPEYVAEGVRRYQLHYTVCRVDVAPAPFTEVGSHGFVWFRFQARDYPEIVSYTANNPRLVN